jgi:hypothetical protein
VLRATEANPGGGAWMHFAVSAAVTVAILIAASPDPRLRARILLFAAVTAVGTALLVAAMMSIDTVRDLFLERAKAIQPYDVGPGGRFWEQRLALGVILDHPNGMGPQQHDVYMQGFLVYGWLGGAAYLTLVAVTLAVGLATVRVPAPWQNYLIVAYATSSARRSRG